MTNNDILESINNIDSIVLESEMNVIKSLIDSYNKSLMILENYEGSNLDSFEMFSESFIMEADDASIPKKKESIIRKILLAIPRLFMWLAKKIKSTWKNRPVARMERELKEMKSAYNKLSKETRNQILDLNNDIEYHENRINDIRSNLKTINNGMEIKTKYNKILNEKIDNLAKTVESNKKDVNAVCNKLNKDLNDINLAMVKKIETLINENSINATQLMQKQKSDFLKQYRVSIDIENDKILHCFDFLKISKFIDHMDNIFDGLVARLVWLSGGDIGATLPSPEDIKHIIDTNINNYMFCDICAETYETFANKMSWYSNRYLEISDALPIFSRTINEYIADFEQHGVKTNTLTTDDVNKLKEYLIIANKLVSRVDSESKLLTQILETVSEIFKAYKDAFNKLK